MMERYRKVVQRRRRSAVLYAVLGAVILAALLATEASIVPRSMESLFVGTGCAALLNGLVNFYRKGKLLRNEEELRRLAVMEFDERNVEVMRRSCTLTLNVLGVLLWIAMVVAGFIDQTICYTLLATLCVGLAVAFVSYVIVWKTL